MNIGWTIYNDPKYADVSQWKDIVYFEPKALWPLVVEERGGADYTKCPAVSDFFDNIFVVRCPYDVIISYQQEGDMFTTDRLGQDWYNQTFYPRFPISKDGKLISSCITLRINYLFVADEDVEIETFDVPLLSNNLTRNIKMIPGKMNIHRWVRPVDFTFEVVDLSKPIELKRGDPMFAIRFKTDSKVKLTHIDYSDDLKHAAEACLASKTYVPHKSLKYRYEMAKRFLKNKRWL